MKIAILINTSWNIYNFRKGLVMSFLKQGHQVLALAPKDNYSERLESLGCQYYDIQMSSQGMNPIKDLGFLRRLKRILREEQPDILLTYTIKPNIYGAIAGASLGIPVIANISGLGTAFYENGLLKKVVSRLYQFAFGKIGAVFFQNKEDKQAFSEAIFFDQSKAFLLPGSGVDVNYFQTAPLPLGQKVTFVMVARLLIDKGVREFVAAARFVHSKRQDVAFILVGSYDPDHPRSITDEEFNDLESSEDIIYYPQQEDIRPILAQATAVVLPSYREGTPKTLLEGGATGRPLITTDVPGCRNVVVHGINGLLCQAKSDEELAKSLLEFIGLSIEEKIAMGQKSRAIVEERFNEQIVINKYQEQIDRQMSST
jgi:glycosyltransferase involved in cell wall biosynthesis